jgi:hypothetical protein
LKMGFLKCFWDRQTAFKENSMINHHLVVFIQRDTGELGGIWSRTFAKIE